VHQRIERWEVPGKEKEKKSQKEIKEKKKEISK
jgi:hypothetical protein